MRYRRVTTFVVQKFGSPNMYVENTKKSNISLLLI